MFTNHKKKKLNKTRVADRMRRDVIIGWFEFIIYPSIFVGWRIPFVWLKWRVVPFKVRYFFVWLFWRRNRSKVNKNCFLDYYEYCRENPKCIFFWRKFHSNRFQDWFSLRLINGHFNISTRTDISTDWEQ